MAPDRIEREILIDAPQDVVWSVITEPDHVSGWFSDTARIDLRPGGAITLVWEGNHTERGRVEAVEPPNRFSFRWIRGGGDEARDGNSTLVEFSLSEEDEGTRLTVVESGFSGLDWPEEDRVKDAEEHRQGWANELDELRGYLGRLQSPGGQP